MRKFIITAALAILAAALLAPTGSAAGKGKHLGKKTFTTKLTGANEVPGPGDPDGRGHATIRTNSRLDRVCFTIVTRRIDAPTAGHIHVGDSKTAGPIVVGLFEGAKDKKVRRGCVATTQAQIDLIRADPSNFYVNVHNAIYPKGALRGQLRSSGR